MSSVVRCHHCSAYVGESSEPLEFVGMFKSPRDVETVQAPRNTWRCPRCGWSSVFRAIRRFWREIETKAIRTAEGARG